jgi:hypothetical protein
VYYLTLPIRKQGCTTIITQFWREQYGVTKYIFYASIMQGITDSLDWTFLIRDITQAIT